MRLPPRGGGVGVRTLPGLSCAAGVCSNRGRVVSSVAVLHHKVVASLRLDFTHPAAHKVAATRDRNINIRIRMSLFLFRVLMAIISHKVAAARIGNIK